MWSIKIKTVVDGSFLITEEFFDTQFSDHAQLPDRVEILKAFGFEKIEMDSFTAHDNRFINAEKTAEVLLEWVSGYNGCLFGHYANGKPVRPKRTMAMRRCMLDLMVALRTHLPLEEHMLKSFRENIIHIDDPVENDNPVQNDVQA